MTTRQRLIGYIKSKKQVTGKELADYLNISKQALFRYFTELLEEGVIVKVGKTPQVFYSMAPIRINKKEAENIDNEIQDIINDTYLIITPSGEKLEGMEGFIYWCHKNKLPVGKTVKEYIKTLEKYNQYKKGEFIDGMAKIKNSFKDVYVDKIFYIDFYAIERFGKTKLGQLLLYAKQSQNKKLIQEIVIEVSPKISELIKKYNIDGIGFIPPTVKRDLQFMKVFENNLKFKQKRIKIVKIKTDIMVPQKTLSRIEERVENAKATFAIDEQSIFTNILLIDDAVGSGATLNEVAKKIKDKSICTGEIIALAITGSFKGFDVISEV